MANDPVTFNYFEIKLNMATGGRLRIAARVSLSDDAEYTTSDETGLVVFEEVLSKLAIALHGKKQPIQLKVVGDEIIRDPSFKLPACSAPPPPPNKSAKAGDKSRATSKKGKSLTTQAPKKRAARKK